jgi:FAD/FMN-containing dehydrogenase
MALYRPDYKLQEAKKLIDSLDGSKENELIKYYIKKDKERIEKQSEQLKEYRDWFDKLNRFLPNKNQVYG